MCRLFRVLLFFTTCAAAQTVEGTIVNAKTGVGIDDVTVAIVEMGKTSIRQQPIRRAILLWSI